MNGGSRSANATKRGCKSAGGKQSSGTKTAEELQRRM